MGEWENDLFKRVYFNNADLEEIQRAMLGLESVKLFQGMIRNYKAKKLEKEVIVEYCMKWEFPPYLTCAILEAADSDERPFEKDKVDRQWEPYELE